MFFGKKISDLTRRADKERDNRNWLQAADIYISAAQKAGNTKKAFRALIQAGNCLKSHHGNDLYQAARIDSSD
ncbi:hypothetical protein PT277_00250 [Acetobacteraceae bacterium ESL0709]|nr:hypothetical protein [Acetobacteraceae bacterium ESL0709]